MSEKNTDASPSIEDCLSASGKPQTANSTPEPESKEKFANLAVRRITHPEEPFRQSYKEAGYKLTKDQTALAAKKKEVNALINPLAEELGITVGKVGAGWRRLLRAKKKIPLVAGRDVITVEVPDNTTQLKSHTEVSKILGLYPEIRLKMESIKRVQLGVEPQTLDALTALKDREKELEAEVEVLDTDTSAEIEG